MAGNLKDRMSERIGNCLMKVTGKFHLGNNHSESQVSNNGNEVPGMKTLIGLRKKYVPQPFPGRITLFLGDESRFMHDLKSGWDKLGLGGVQVHILPGKHTDMLRESNVQVLAQRLKVCLEKAE